MSLQNPTIPPSIPLTGHALDDAVRRQWEDVLAGGLVGPFLKSLLEHLEEQGRGLRVLELGAGTGEGLDFLLRIPQADSPLGGTAPQVLRPDRLAAYHGLESDRRLVQATRKTTATDPRVRIGEWDPETGLRDAGEEPYDLYLTRNSVLSRLSPEAVAGLLADIAHHAGPRALVVLDWLGAYSYEWQPLWPQRGAPLVLATDDGPLYPMVRDDAANMVETTSRKEKVFLRVTAVMDRAPFLGPHMDTRRHNPDAQPLRALVNSLLDPSRRTDLADLHIRYTPREGFGQANAFFLDFSATWNAVIGGVQSILKEREDAPAIQAVPITAQGLVERTLARLRGVTRLVLDSTTGDPRAEIFEPYLATVLRDLSFQFQQGLGCGAGLTVVAEIRKSERKR